ncbi:low-CO2-inducible protein [Volvox carteri f. nagariensis]|uniref:Low-CO2-inducible protein n=1 Tax=Volvox carteri f. nagariensis TaxID=3068 RepID=D8UEX8_VOLCA|nr:low-CO2-inducible protein [Volvox carteri f. nagariensis]EFJ41720.1 low-CO2-inducible protein [Volvox carteri f. nagariensis]|eukprot:XP_002957222.1 low-CO2-inducible protein [Volvox carteri f. nagariensis]
MRNVSTFRQSRASVVPSRVTNCRREVRMAVSTPSSSRSNSSAVSALSITASAAASALLAKVAALLAAGAPGALPAVLHMSSPACKGSEKEHHWTSAFQGALAEKVVVAAAPSPAALSAVSAISLPGEWRIISSAAEWFDLHSEASSAGALLATVFISDNAAVAHAALLERLHQNFGTGVDAPVRLVFVRINEGYEQRNRAAAAACAASGTAPALVRGAADITLSRVAHTAALHGLDVALTSFLPDGVRAFPSLLLTAGPVAAGAAAAGGDTAAAPWSWLAATRVGELTQLVSDWAFIIDLRRRRQRDLVRQQIRAEEGVTVPLPEPAGWDKAPQVPMTAKAGSLRRRGGSPAVLISA